MSLPKRVICVFVVVCLGFTARHTYADCAAPAARSVIKFYEYQGSQTPDAAANFSVFRKVVDEEVELLKRSRTGPLGIALATEPAPDARHNYAAGRLNTAVSLQIMNNDTRLLELLDGRMQQNPQSHLYVIHSDIYLAPEPGANSVNLISEDFVLDQNAHDDARSLHVAATWYALAVQAGLRTCRAAQVTYLTRAAEALSDVGTAGGSGAKSLRSIVRAAQQVLGLPQ